MNYKMNRYRKIARNLGFLVLAAASIWGFFAAMGEVMSRFSEQIVYDIVGCEDDKCMVAEDDIRTILDKDFNELLMGAKISEVDLKSIEVRLEAEPHIADADVYLDSRTRVNVKVTPREAALRVQDQLGQSYYIDVNGIKFPLSRRFTPRVVVASGHIKSFDKPLAELDSTHTVRQLFDLWKILDTDLFLQAMVEQIVVRPDGDMVLIPKVGDHEVIFGKMDEMAAERLDNLKIFYKEAYPQKGWTTYKQLNIKYKDQVIASKE
jgi:cell division protein FtsQ